MSARGEMTSISSTVRGWFHPKDVCTVCDDAFPENEAERARCYDDCRSGRFGSPDVSCASPWWRVFEPGSDKHICIDRNVFVVLLTLTFLSICMAAR